MAESHPFSHDVEALLALLDVARHLSIPVPLAKLLSDVIDAGRRVLRVDRGTVFLYDAKTRELYATVATGQQEIRFSVDRGIAGECARTRQTIHVPDCYADPRFNPEIDRHTGYRTRCLVALPLVGLDGELVGVMQLLNPLTKPCFDDADLRLAGVLCAQAAASIQRAQLITSHEIKVKLEEDLALARQIQNAVLPKVMPRCPGYDVSAFGRPAEATGGDIFDLIALPLIEQGMFFETSEPPVASDGLLLFMADATGHGVGPAISVTQVRAMLRIGTRLGAGLDTLMSQMNNQLVADLESKRFVTAFLGRLDPVSHRITYHSAGQAPLMHYRAAQRDCVWLDASTMPLGVMTDPPLDQPSPILMQPGDLFVLLTDGFYEYFGPDDEFMGKERIAQCVIEHAHQSAQELIHTLLTAIEDFAQGCKQADDLTAVIVKRQLA